MEALLPSLALLACPVGMGLMMWFMARGNRAAKAADATQISQRPSDAEESPMSLEVLREEHRRLADEIDRLEQRPASGREPADRR